MKIEQKKLARECRKNGMSIKDIAKKFSVSSSTASVWTKDIELTQVQREALNNKRFNVCNREKAVAEHSRRCLASREESQMNGRLRARENDPEHIKACMLYWGEGSKSRSAAAITNTDVDILKLFVRFLKNEFGVENKSILISINFYETKTIKSNDVEEYWLHQLGLGKESLRATTKRNKYYGDREVKNFYGICRVRVHRTDIVQHIYGAIQEYANCSKPEWINIAG